MTPERLKRWKKDILARLDILKSKARQARHYLEANSLPELKDTSDISDAWLRVRERFPDDLKPPPVNDLGRHLAFAMPHDFSDIESLDIPAIESSIESATAATVTSLSKTSWRRSTPT